MQHTILLGSPRCEQCSSYHAPLSLAMSKNKSYHFSLGNSSTGPIGFCARVTASSKADALTKVRNRIEDLHRELSVPLSDDDGTEYLNVYFNPAAISVRSVDEVTDSTELDDEVAAFRHEPNQ